MLANWLTAARRPMTNSPLRKTSSASKAPFIKINPTLIFVCGPTSAKCCWRATRFFMWTETDFSLNRRSFLRVSAGGLGSLALAHLFGMEARAADAPHSALRIPRSSASPLAPKAPHHKPRAKSVICLFQHGGPSQMDLFDPKPELNKRDGQEHPGELEIHFNKQAGKLLKSPFAFRPRSEER